MVIGSSLCYFFFSGVTAVRIIFAVLGKFCINASFSTIYVFSTELLPTVIRFDIVIYWLKISVNRHPVSRLVRREPVCRAAGTKNLASVPLPSTKKPRSLIMTSLIQTLFQFRLSHPLIRWWCEAVSIVSLILTHPLAAVERELAALWFFYPFLTTVSRVRATFYMVMNRTTGKCYSVAFIWMVTLYDFIHRLKS